MPTIGEELKAAREARGLTLTEIAEKTRISHTFLKALEEDDYSIIPGEVFVTGFLRTYAKELGLNVKDIIAKYREIRPKEPQVAPEAEEAVQHKPKPSLISISRRRYQPERIPGAGKRRSPLYIIIVGGLILGAVLTGITLLVTKKPPELQLPAPPAPARKAAAPAPPAQKPMTSFKTESSFKPRTAIPPPPPAKPAQAGPLILKLTADKDSYYSYRTDKSRRASGTLKKGRTLEIKADNEIILTLGNAGGVRAEFNGKGIAPFGKEAEVVKDIVFTREKAGVIPPLTAPAKKPAPGE